MSLKPFIFNEYTTYIIEYSYTDYKGVKQRHRRPSYEKTEEAAIKDAMESLQVTHYPDFFMTIVGKKVYKKK